MYVCRTCLLKSSRNQIPTKANPINAVSLYRNNVKHPTHLFARAAPFFETIPCWLARWSVADDELPLGSFKAFLLRLHLIEAMQGNKPVGICFLLVPYHGLLAGESIFSSATFFLLDADVICKRTSFGFRWNGAHLEFNWTFERSLCSCDVLWKRNIT